MIFINRSIKGIFTLAACSLVLLTPDLRADESDRVFDFSAREDTAISTVYEFDGDPALGFERKNIAKNLRIRGWEISNRLYVGQAKVANKWGIGLVYDHGATVFGINHRGLQILKRF